MYTKQYSLLFDGTYKGNDFITVPDLVRNRFFFDLYNISIWVLIYML